MPELPFTSDFAASAGMSLHLTGLILATSMTAGTAGITPTMPGLVFGGQLGLGDARRIGPLPHGVAACAGGPGPASARPRALR